MENGLRRAVLATLETRSWSVEGQPMSGEQVVALYHALASADPHAPSRAIGAFGRSDRRFDRAVQILKKAGLIVHYGGRWRQTVDGVDV